VREPGRTPAKSAEKYPPSWDFNRLATLLKTNLEEIRSQSPLFFGSLSIEVSFREGLIETVAVERRQTFKD
jgi:hypothetical protein